MRNGSIAHFTTIKRDLVIAVDASLYPDIGGGTDSETLFYLALGLGLEENVPPEASCLEIGAGKLELLDFTAKPPPDAVPASA